MKKGIQLSLNMIIYVILGLVFLSIAIYLIRAWIPQVPDTPSPCDIYPPTIDSPVCAPNEIELARGEEKNIDLAFYNDEDADIPATVAPSIVCSADVDGNVLNLQTAGAGMNLPIGETADYLLVVKVPRDATRGTFPCTLTLSNTVETLAVTVK